MTHARTITRLAQSDSSYAMKFIKHHINKNRLRFRTHDAKPQAENIHVAGLIYAARPLTKQSMALNVCALLRVT